MRLSEKIPTSLAFQSPGLCDPGRTMGRAAVGDPVPRAIDYEVDGAIQQVPPGFGSHTKDGTVAEIRRNVNEAVDCLSAQCLA